MSAGKILIAGSRDFTTEEHYSILRGTVLDFMEDFRINEIISGKARGSDSLGERFAREYDISVTEFIPEWDRYGKRAGMIRNEQMGNYCDRAIIFWDGKSKGTKHMIGYLRKLRKPVNTILYNEKDIFDEF